MKKRAFTLVEVMVVVVIIGMITVTFFPFLIFEMKNINRSFAFTADTFEAQTKINNELVALNELVGDKDVSSIPEDGWGDWTPLKIKLFEGRTLDAVSRVVTTENKDIGTEKDYRRDALIILPKSRVTVPKVPKIKVSLDRVSPSGKEFSGKVSYNPKKDIDEVVFCVYRWYIGDSSLKQEGKIPPSNLVMIREYNEAKNGGDPRFFKKSTQFKFLDVKADEVYNDESFKVLYFKPVAYIDGDVPLINSGVTGDKREGDRFKINSLNMKPLDDFSEDDMKRLYNNKSLVFSAMIVTKKGELGEETYSDAFELGYKEEEHLLGVSTNIEEVGETNKLRFLIRQILNLEKNKKYKIHFEKYKSGILDTSLYLDPTSGSDVYGLSNRDMGVFIQMNDEGFLTFDVLLSKIAKYDIVVSDDKGEIFRTFLDY